MMKTKLIVSLTSVVLAGAVFNAQATDFNYNYVEGAYENYDTENTDADVGKLSGSYAITPNLNIIGDYATGDIDNPSGGTDLDFEKSSIGIEYHTPIAPTTDLTTNIKYINQDIGSADGSVDNNGYGVGVGVRHQLTDKVEANANIDYSDFDNSDDTSLKVGARYHFNESISAGVAYSTSREDEDIASTNIRWSF